MRVVELAGVAGLIGLEELVVLLPSGVLTFSSAPLLCGDFLCKALPFSPSLRPSFSCRFELAILFYGNNLRPEN